MTAPLEIVNLVAAFQQQIELHQTGQINETQTRIQFIDPFFEALGWDVSNKKNLSLVEQEVIHEDRLKIVGSKKPKAPDYSFQIGNKRQFFVEAKKPSVNVGKDINAAFQLRRYGWSAKLPISILTDFEELSIYDCRIMPGATDSANQARIKYYKYTDYVEKWDEIYQLFSKEAILKGSLNQFIEEKIKVGIPVDKAFLQEIEVWRENLATNIAFRNPQIKQRELNFAVQMTINRLVFLRICEDRGIDRYEQLLELLQRKNIYQELGRLFVTANDRYNSGLFHFKLEKGREAPDDFTLQLEIDDFTLKTIIQKLYPPESPYEFSIIPVEILGQVYEQFLGKVIRLSPRQQVIVEDKPEVRKSGGVYYTPTYIVDYIVKQTIGSALAEKTPEKVKDLTVLDPSCGSGSFLLVAYQYLLDWYLDQYSNNIKKYRKKLYQINNNRWKLKSAEKKRILLDHIYGVDIDQQAVEMTKLSLLLKVLEGESGEMLTKQLDLFKERALPDLDNNIQCGNSLIDGDFYQNNQLSLLDEETRYRVNIFDWQASFPKIMQSGGFDVIIGNPPYVRIQLLKKWASLEADFYKQYYHSANKGNYDIYVIFIEKGLALLKDRGNLAFILPHKFFNAQYGESIRNIISKNNYLREITYFGEQQIFEKITTYTCLLFLVKNSLEKFQFNNIKNVKEWSNDYKSSDIKEFSSLEIDAQAWNFQGSRVHNIINKSKQNTEFLGNLADIFVGTQTSADEVFVLENCVIENNYVIGHSKSLNKSVRIELELTKAFLRGKQIRRYSLPATTSYLICPYLISDEACQLLKEEELINKFPLTMEYFLENKPQLEAREKGKFKDKVWYGFAYPKSMTIFQKSKIIVPDYNNVSSFTLDHQGHFYKTGYGIILNTNNSDLSLPYILGLLNSKLLFKFLLSIGTFLRGGYVRFWTQYLDKIPIYIPQSESDYACQDKIIGLVHQMLTLHQELQQEKISPSRKMLQNQISATEKQINQLVYQLYGITEPQEIAIIEGDEI
ncbi:MAG: restriction endonuclease subunit M [Snowella sp.]|nr:MAG: restriction endonuclease subunit M [Snowella sp.]